MVDVIKIGGSILSSIEDLDFCARKIACATYSKLPIIVVSAFKNYTDSLLKMNNYFSNTPSSFVITTGEQITAGLLEIAISKYGKKAKAMAGWQVPIIIGSQYENGMLVETQKLEALLAQGIMPIITGFQGVDDDFNIKDLGRGGSDLTAVALAKAFNGKCVLLKKSGGVCSADPNLIDECFVWSHVGYDDLVHLAESGSRVIQKEALVVAKDGKVPLKVTNLDFATQTDINTCDSEFWSVLAYGNKLRIVTNKLMQKIKDYGFSFHDNYYEVEVQNDLRKSAHEVYALCKRYL